MNSVVEHTFDLRKSDGTPAGTQPVFQQIPPIRSTSARSPRPSLGNTPIYPYAKLFHIDGTLFFSIEEGE